MPLIIRADTPEQAVAAIATMIRAEEQRFLELAPTKSTKKTREVYAIKARACDHIASMLEDSDVAPAEHAEAG